MEQLFRVKDDFAENEKALVVMEASDNPRRDAETIAFLRGMNEDHIAKGHRDLIHSISIAKGKCPEARQLEAADMVAWIVRRRLSKKRKHFLDDFVVTGDFPVTYFDMKGKEMRGYIETTATIVELFRIYGDD